MIFFKTPKKVCLVTESLLNDIKEKNPEILSESINLIDYIDSMIKQSYNVDVDKKQQEKIKDELKKYNTKEQEEIFKNSSQRKKFIDDIVISLGINNNSSVKDIVDKKIIDNQIEINNGDISNDVKTSKHNITSQKIDNAAKEYKQEQYKKMSNAEKNKKIKDEDKILNTRTDVGDDDIDKTELSTFEYENKDVLEFYEDEQIFHSLARLSRRIIDRCIHVIRVASGLYGDRHFISRNLGLLVGGFKITKLYKSDPTLTMKYYLSEYERLNPNKALTLKKIFTANAKELNALYRGDTDDAIDKTKKLRDDISSTVYLMTIQKDEDFNTIRRAIYMDDLLSSKFNISSSGRQQVLNIREDIITFSPKDNNNLIACIIVMRPLLPKLSKLYEPTKQIFNDLSNIKVM